MIVMGIVIALLIGCLGAIVLYGPVASWYDSSSWSVPVIVVYATGHFVE